MVYQVPSEKLLDFLDYFRGIKYLRNILVNLSFNKSGYVVTDNVNDPTLILCSPSPNAWIWFLVGDFTSKNKNAILSEIPEDKGILVPTEHEQEWLTAFKQHWAHVDYFTRTTLSAKSLKVENIRTMITPLPVEYSLVEVHDKEMNQIAKNWEGWDKMTNYQGYCIKEREKVVSIAIGSLNLPKITNSLEIAIQTMDEYRGRGFATIVGAKLIEYCLLHHIEPHWDAANDLSVKLALKLGYTDPESYKCYYWKKNE